MASRIIHLACAVRDLAPFVALFALALLSCGCSTTPVRATEFNGRLYYDTGIRIGPGESITIAPDGGITKDRK